MSGKVIHQNFPSQEIYGILCRYSVRHSPVNGIDTDYVKGHLVQALYLHTTYNSTYGHTQLTEASILLPGPLKNS